MYSFLRSRSRVSVFLSPVRDPPVTLHGEVVTDAGFAESVSAIRHAKTAIPHDHYAADTRMGVIEFTVLMIERDTFFVSPILVERVVALDGVHA